MAIKNAARFPDSKLYIPSQGRAVIRELHQESPVDHSQKNEDPAIPNVKTSPQPWSLRPRELVMIYEAYERLQK
ncbi:hypothetical protein RJZ56_005917 [Blastomyces dermatitidis]